MLHTHLNSADSEHWGVSPNGAGVLVQLSDPHGTQVRVLLPPDHAVAMRDAIDAAIAKVPSLRLEHNSMMEDYARQAEADGQLDLAARARETLIP